MIRVAEVSLLDGKTTRTRAIQRLVPVERHLLGENMAVRPDCEGATGRPAEDTCEPMPSEELDVATEENGETYPVADESEETFPMVQEMILRSGRVLQGNNSNNRT